MPITIKFISPTASYSPRYKSILGIGTKLRGSEIIKLKSFIKKSKLRNYKNFPIKS